jgi:hypothetical protein
MSAKLIGNYLLDKANLLPATPSDFSLVITKRHKTSLNKPKEYLLLKQSGSYKYLSSLYPINENRGILEPIIWELEYKGAWYELKLNKLTNRAEIRLIGVASSRAA